MLVMKGNIFDGACHASSLPVYELLNDTAKILLYFEKYKLYNS